MSKRTRLIASMLMSLVLAFSLLSGLLSSETVRASPPALTRVQTNGYWLNVNSGGKITLAGKLCDASGNPLTSQVLKFYVGASVVGQAQTGADGWAQLDYTANLLAGPYQVKVAFEHNAQYYASSGFYELIVTSSPLK